MVQKKQFTYNKQNLLKFIKKNKILNKDLNNESLISKVLMGHLIYKNKIRRLQFRLLLDNYSSNIVYNSDINIIFLSLALKFLNFDINKLKNIKTLEFKTIRKRICEDTLYCVHRILGEEKFQFFIQNLNLLIIYYFKII